MNKHTPGPWKTAGINGITVNALNGDTILACPGGSYKAEISELRANARLIAAAPDLLESLKIAQARIADLDWALYTYNRKSECHGLIDAVIAKAEGRDKGDSK